MSPTPLAPPAAAALLLPVALPSPDGPRMAPRDSGGTLGPPGAALAFFSSRYLRRRSVCDYTLSAVHRNAHVTRWTGEYVHLHATKLQR